MTLTRTDLRSVPHQALHVPAGRERWHADGVSTDSRTVAPGQLYVALRGEKFDGHRFIADVLARGAAGVVVDAQGAAAVPADAVVLVVGHSNTLPEILGRLGVPGVQVGDDDYGNLFVVVRRDGKATLVTLRY